MPRLMDAGTGRYVEIYQDGLFKKVRFAPIERSTVFEEPITEVLQKHRSLMPDYERGALILTDNQGVPLS